jgi:quercetin dioxygenase-like cupin family protein
MSLLIEPSDLAGTPGSLRFIGAEHDDVPVSLFLVSSPPGEGPELHRHPYPEIFIVHAGQAEFQLDDARVEARAGNILIAPAGVPHRFTSVGSDELRLTAIHTAAQMETEWLESTSRRPAAAMG